MLQNIMEKKGPWQFWGAIVLGVSLVASAYLAGKIFIAQKKLDRVVAVKGMAEQIVKSDRVIWEIAFSSNNDNLTQAYQGIAHAQETTKNFLVKQGFDAAAVELVPISIIDNQNNSYTTNQKIKRYTATSGISIKTDAVDKVSSSIQQIGLLVKEGVLVTGSNARFTFTQLNSIKPAMLEAATDSARVAAETFAKNSHSQLGQISSANQGLFTIEGAGSNPYDDSSFMKKVRVVTSVSYYLV